MTIQRVLLHMKYFNDPHREWLKFQAAIVGAKLT